MKKVTATVLTATLAAGLWITASIPAKAEPSSARQSIQEKRRGKAVSPNSPRERRDRRDDRRDQREHWDRADDRRDDRRGDRWEDRWRDRYDRFNRWEDWLDVRRAVAGARLMAGMIFASLPPDCTRVVIAGDSYYFCEETYFTRVLHRGAISYRVTRPPVGVTVTRIPVEHTVEVIKGETFYQADEVYYLRRGEEFVVVVKPL